MQYVINIIIPKFVIIDVIFDDILIYIFKILKLYIYYAISYSRIPDFFIFFIIDLSIL